MAGSEAGADDDAARLEAALARIERARIVVPARHPAAPGEAGPGREALKSRLDALIAELRSVLGRDSSD